MSTDPGPFPAEWVRRGYENERSRAEATLRRALTEIERTTGDLRREMNEQDGQPVQTLTGAARSLFTHAADALAASAELDQLQRDRSLTASALPI